MIERMKITKLLTYLIVLLPLVFAFGFAFMEYNFFLKDGVPFREAQSPLFATLYVYDILVIIPVLLVLCFSPLFFRIMYENRPLSNFRRPVALSVGIFLITIVIKDAGWFLFRRFVPVSSDPLGYQWIRPSDYTASLIGYADIMGLRIPVWYVALLPIIIAIFVTLIISKNVEEETVSAFP